MMQEEIILETTTKTKTNKKKKKKKKEKEKEKKTCSLSNFFSFFVSNLPSFFPLQDLEQWLLSV